MSSSPLPFDTVPDTEAHRYVEQRTQHMLADLYRMWAIAYGPDGTMPRETVEARILSAVGTIMLRVADMGVSTVLETCPEVPEAKARGDFAIFLVRSAGLLMSELPGPILASLIPHLARELQACAGLAEPPPSAPREPAPAPEGLPLTPLKTSACNINLVGDGYYDLPARREGGSFTTWWTPSDEAKAAIAAGLPIKVNLICPQHPGIRLEVEAL